MKPPVCFPRDTPFDWTTVPLPRLFSLPSNPAGSSLGQSPQTLAPTPSLLPGHHPATPTPSVLSVHAESKRDASARHCSPVSSSSEQSPFHHPPPFNSSHQHLPPDVARPPRPSLNDTDASP